MPFGVVSAWLRSRPEALSYTAIKADDVVMGPVIPRPAHGQNLTEHRNNLVSAFVFHQPVRAGKLGVMGKEHFQMRNVVFITRNTIAGHKVIDLDAGFQLGKCHSIGLIIISLIFFNISLSLSNIA